MHFALSVAKKYLIPKWRQLSVSIISLISTLVISLVVWLSIVFLSVTDGVQKNWLDQLVSLNAPVRMTPTEAYYSSYFYKIDSVSSDTGYATRSIGEKLLASSSDPYDPTYDAELPMDFPTADRKSDGSLKDPVKEAFAVVQNIHGARPQEYEVALANMRLALFRELPGTGFEESYISQVSYFTNSDPDNHAFQEMILPPSADDLNNLLFSLPPKDLVQFFDHLDLVAVKTSDEYFPLTSTLYPHDGHLKACAILRGDDVARVIVPRSLRDLKPLCQKYKEMGYDVMEVTLNFQNGTLLDPFNFITLDKGVVFQATVVKNSVAPAQSYHNVHLHLNGEIQGLFLSGNMPMNHLEILKANTLEGSPLWAYQSDIPVDSDLGDGVVISQSYLKNGVKIGDRGYLSYFAATPTSSQEQRLPIYVAGFYDPGLVSIGNKFAFVDPKVTSSLRGSMSVADSTLGNGINVWVPSVKDAPKVKSELIANLNRAGIGQYWNVESYQDYEFVKPILQQLSSDKTIFTLIAILILLVACSNIISMLILLVNDKRREIGIMRAMGATGRDVAMIFGLCGFVMGVISCVVGTVLAIFTIHHIEKLVKVLSFFKGHEMFQTAFFGTMPNFVSWSAVAFVLIATLFLSVVAGLIPAIKAAKVSPTEALRGE